MNCEGKRIYMALKVFSSASLVRSLCKHSCCARPKKSFPSFFEISVRSAMNTVRLVPTVRTDLACLKTADHNPNAHILRITHVFVGTGCRSSQQNVLPTSGMVTLASCLPCRRCMLRGRVFIVIVVFPTRAEEIARSRSSRDACSFIPVLSR